MSPYRIIAMDGGGTLSLLGLALMQRIEDARPGFLSSTDMFAGTSAGGINATLLAMTELPESMLPAASRIWEEGMLMDTTLARLVTGATGLTALASPRRLTEYLTSLLGERTLGDLALSIVIPAFDTTANTMGYWAPRVYHNLYQDGHSQDEPAVHIGLRTSAAPIVFPMWEGNVDGGVFANDPTMCAITQALSITRAHLDAAPMYGDTSSTDVDRIDDPPGLDDLVVLSFGSGTSPMSLTAPGESTDWGWGQWLLSSKFPMALLELVIAANSEVPSTQARVLLGDESYFRVNPPLPPNVSRFGFDEKAVDHIKLLAAETDIVPILDWLDGNGWCMQDGSSAPRAARTKAAR